MPQENPGGRLAAIEEEVITCRACPRLVAWREAAATDPRASFRDETYWAKPVPSFGDEKAAVVIVGLAPAANGGNRTGRMFTGDRSGDFLFASLFRTGFANQKTSTRRDDGLALRGAYITGAVRCAPPENRPTPKERDTCLHFLSEELEVIETASVLVALGAFALDALWRSLSSSGCLDKKLGRFRFSHGAQYVVDARGAPGTHGQRTVLCSYHPSQRNVFTGLLTEDALDAIFVHARELSKP